MLRGGVRLAYSGLPGDVVEVIEASIETEMYARRKVLDSRGEAFSAFGLKEEIRWFMCQLSP